MSNAKRDYPASIEIQPLNRPPVCQVRPPGSKSITNRALILAALSDPASGSELRGVLQSEDTEVMVDALRALGFQVKAAWEDCAIQIRNGSLLNLNAIPAAEADLFVANSGTSMRFLTALVSLGFGRYRLDGVTRMHERPLADLLAALHQLGVESTCEREEGFPPVVIRASGLSGGHVRIKGHLSSQFLSALLMVAPLARAPVTIEVEGSLVSRPYVGMTLSMMRQFGVEVNSVLLTRLEVPAPTCYSPQIYAIEPDASAASYFAGVAAITGGEVTIDGLDSSSLQGDVRFITDVLRRMGCDVVLAKKKLTARGQALHGIEEDMIDISDCVMTLAAVACFAKGPTTIRNVAHIRHKESDRLAALANELRRVGADVDEFPDGLHITPRPLHGAVIETYNDHRMAMSMALLGLRIPGIIINNPGCVAKTYPDFFEDLEHLRS